MASPSEVLRSRNTMLDYDRLQAAFEEQKQQRAFQNKMGEAGLLVQMAGLQRQKENDVFAREQQAFENQLAQQRLAILQNGGARAAASKPLPASISNAQTELLGDIGLSGSIASDMGAYEQLLADDKLNLGPMSNMWNSTRNFVGLGSDESKNYASFRSSLEKMRNDSLRLNKGVQTEGDAQRAWNELFANINDEGVVKQRLAEIQQINARGSAIKADLLNQIRDDYGRERIDTSKYFNQAPVVGGGNNPAAGVGGWKYLGAE